MSDYWTPARIEKLHKAWVAGQTGDGISSEWGITKGMVLGKVHRMIASGKYPDMLPRGNPVGKKGPGNKGQRHHRTVAARTPKQVAKTAEFATRPRKDRQPFDVHDLEVVNVRAESVWVPKRNLVVPLGHITQGGTKTCQWIHDFETRNRRFCDAPTVLGMSWCCEHRGRVFIRREELTHAPRG
jgi:hypothetical protein